MEYQNVEKAIFLSRPNRFIAHVQLGEETLAVHVKNTGRCKELLIPGVTVYLTKGNSDKRKTPYDLIAVEKMRPRQTPLLVNMDSQAPNQVAAEWIAKGNLFPPGSLIRREVTIDNSRLDLAVTTNEETAYVEVKGCTLEDQGVCRFPDAPTLRGVKHLNELAALASKGIPSYLLMVVQMDEMKLFRPNEATHPEFAQALRNAVAAGVQLHVLTCAVTPNTLEINGQIPYCLDKEESFT